MNPQHMFYANALRAQRQEQQQPTAMDSLPPQQQAEQLYRHLLNAGMTHDTALTQATAHLQRLMPQQHQPQSAARSDDYLTNNANLQQQGHGTASSQYPDGVAHD